MDKQLHIVSFDIPLPANYGGVIDVFYKIKALHKAGVKIILHCFQYGDKQQADELLAYCQEVHYYKRLTGIQGFSLLRPYIVNSRKNRLLLKNLTQVDAPILCEGLHTCYYLNHPALKDRKKFVRAHNIEHDYYNALALSALKWWKRWYYKSEAKLLARYEQILKEADAVFAIAEKDAVYFSEAYNTKLIGGFHSNNSVTSVLGPGEYCLYHGNLAVSENEEAALFLIQNVFSGLDYPAVIAGANPSKKLEEAITECHNVKLIANPTSEEMALVMSQAHVHVLYATERSGLKLKLLNALFQGRFVLANESLLENEALQSAASLANTAKDYTNEITRLYQVDFKQNDIEKRKRLLSEKYSNDANAQKIIEEIFPTLP